MHRTASALIVGAAVLAGPGLSACDAVGGPASTSTTASTTSAAAPVAPPVAPLPDPAALADVVYRLADVNVPGTEKVGLVEDATVDDAPALEGFGRALRDGGYVPLTVAAADLVWSPADPGNVVANVTMGTTNPDVGEFSYPMEFSPDGPHWQLTRQTADLLLDMGANP